MAHISLIIPARNEAALLPRLLDTVDVARQRYRGGADAIEVILADNVSTDRTASIAVERGCRVVTVRTRVIAAVRNGGAHAARGAILAFVDADSQIHPNTFNAIDTAIATGRVVGGATGVSLERWSLGLVVTFALFIPLVWGFNMDTGVVFCRRDAFEGVGGYREGMTFAEDVQFLFDLRRWGRPQNLRLMRTRQAKTIASTRKFDTHGDWHYVTGMFTLPLRWLVSRKSVEAFVQSYWYDARG